MTDNYEQANKILVGALDDLGESRARGDELIDMLVLVVTAGEGESEHVLNGLSVPSTQRIGTLRWFQMRAEHQVVQEWDEE